MWMLLQWNTTNTRPRSNLQIPSKSTWPYIKNSYLLLFFSVWLLMQIKSRSFRLLLVPLLALNAVNFPVNAATLVKDGAVWAGRTRRRAYLLPVSRDRQKQQRWITEEFRPTSTTPGPGNSSNTLLPLDTCGWRIAFTHNGYHRAYLQRERKKVKQKQNKKNSVIKESDGSSLKARPRRPPKNKSPQKLFQAETMLLHHVSHYHSTAFGCYKNPYLSLFNLNCGFRYRVPH